MAKVTRRAPTDIEARAARVSALASLGLKEGQRVRFRRDASSRWIEGDATAVEPDGSLALVDNRGRQRSIPIEMIQAQSRGPRGGKVWVSVVDLAARIEQTELVEPERQPKAETQPEYTAPRKRTKTAKRSGRPDDDVSAQNSGQTGSAEHDQGAGLPGTDGRNGPPKRAEPVDQSEQLGLF